MHDPATLCFICGPPTLVDEMPKLLDNLGVPRYRVRVEEWGEKVRDVKRLARAADGVEAGVDHQDFARDGARRRAEQKDRRVGHFATSTLRRSGARSR